MGCMVDAGALVGAGELVTGGTRGSTPFSSRMTISSAVTRVTTPLLAWTAVTTPESQAALYSMPVPTMGASGLSSGTA